MADSRELKIRVLLEALDRFTRPMRAMSKETQAATGKLKALRTEQKRLSAASKDLNALTKLREEMRGAGNAIEDARRRAKALASQISATEKPTKALRLEHERAGQTVRKLVAQQQEQVSRYGQLRSKLKEVIPEVKSLSAAEAELKRRMQSTTNEAVAQQKKLDALAARSKKVAAGRASAGRLGAASSQIAVGGAASMATGLTIGRPIVATANRSMEQQSVLTDIGQKANVARGDRGAMGDRLQAIAEQVNQELPAVFAAVDALASRGLEGKAAEALTKPMGRAATAYRSSMEDISAAAFATADNLGVPTRDIARSLDIMAATGKRGSFEMGDMARHFPSLTASAKALGQEGVGGVADLAAALQIAAKGAGSADEAATNLDNLMQKIGAPSTVRAFEKMGVNLPKALKEAAKAGKSPIEAITELTNKTLGGDLSRLGYLFEDAQVQKAMRPLIQNFEQYKKIRAEALGATGVVDTDFADRMDDAAEQVRQLRIDAGGLANTAGKSLLPMIAGAARFTRGLVVGLRNWAKANPGLSKALFVMAAVLAGVLVVLGGLAILLAAILAPFAALAFVAAALSPAFLPVLLIIGAVILAIALLAGAALLIAKYWKPVMQWFSGLWVSFKTWGSQIIEGLINGIKEKLGALKSTIVGAAKAAASWFKERLGIHSPSRVFMELGVHTMTGLDHGLDRGSRRPLDRITSVAGRMTAAAALAIAPGASAASGSPLLKALDASRQLTMSAASTGTPISGSGVGLPGGAAAQVNNYEVHFHPAPGMDERALFEMFQKWIETRGGTGAGRPRNTFDDED